MLSTTAPALRRAVTYLSCLLLIGACSSNASEAPVGGSGSGNNGGGNDPSGSNGGDDVPTFVPTEPEAPTEPPGEFQPCADISQCQEGELCVEGTCRPTSGACTTDADCLGDYRCCGAGCRTDGGEGGLCVPNDGVDATCRKERVGIGVFAPDLQCQWAGPAPGDPFASHSRVMATPLVADLPNDSGAAGEIVIVTGDESMGAQIGEPVWDPRIDPQTGQSLDPRFNQPSRGGVIRILNGQTCELLETVATGAPEANTYVRSPATPAIGDLDGDGTMEIVARVQHTAALSATETRIIAYKWNPGAGRFEQFWLSADGTGALPDNSAWDGVSLHDVNGDGLPEVVARFGTVFNGQTGALLSTFSTNIATVADPIVGDVDADGQVELVANQVFGWNGSGWTLKYPGPNQPADAAPPFYAYADFGTPGASPAAFDPTTLDGIAEIVTTGLAGTPGMSQVSLYTLDGQAIFQVTLAASERGGPPTIGDFDNDGAPEIASASASAFRVYDIDCAAGGAGCAEPYVRWSQPAQDESSAQTGSSIFDFEGDGKAEAVYADECFLRVYAGETGDVLFSAFRASCTWVENPVIADPDRDTRTEIIVNSNINCRPSCPAIDPIDPGVRCEKNEDCRSQLCTAGFCRCQTDLDCGNDFVEDPTRPSVKSEGLTCTDPPAGPDPNGQVCRAQHPASTDGFQLHSFNTVKVYRDVLDRWADSRPLWNQHAYSVTNINDDGSIPAADAWVPNFKEDALNNFRQNRQGDKSAELLPDITGALDRSDICKPSNTAITLTGHVCNRGLRVVGADMPATFYLGAPDAGGQVLCVSYTQGPVQLGNACLPVSCDVTQDLPDDAQVYMVVNDDGAGNATTEECNSDNNIDTIIVDSCTIIR